MSSSCHHLENPAGHPQTVLLAAAMGASLLCTPLLNLDPCQSHSRKRTLLSAVCIPMEIHLYFPYELNDTGQSDRKAPLKTRKLDASLLSLARFEVLSTNRFRGEIQDCAMHYNLLPWRWALLDNVSKSHTGAMSDVKNNDFYLCRWEICITDSINNCVSANPSKKGNHM